ncbi:hypothetical protein F5144DRAFT_171672 [Chaetomium tenue]|uniref:Uncharacterized protein n=1 Tax=Chaetomium tenue TaxID=1854479 RepID=A0ACB7PGS0_9PEZI|nr:hypothetical protein F5144DRAFT_171672 [Chaetomium globosum]
MVTRRSQTLAEQKQKAQDVIEILSSDSEPEAPDVEDDVEEPTYDNEDIHNQPLLRAAGIKYKPEPQEDEELQQDEPHSVSGAKLAVRNKETGAAKHRHVSIEIPLPASAEARRKKTEASASESQEGNDEDVFKTPKEHRKHITFDDSDHDEFVTPREGPSKDPMETITAGTNEKDDEEDEEEESDDEAPPEAVSTRVAEAETLKAAGAAAKAVEQQAAALKRKRQERDTFLRQQAAERKQTQKKPIRQDDEDDEDTPGIEDPALETEKRREVPKLLPLELLESDDEDDVPQQTDPDANGQHKRRKLGAAEQALLREPKLPKDKRLGSAAYRVVKRAGDVRLAPRVKKQAVNLKEALLRRDRIAQPRGGFFVKNR